MQQLQTSLCSSLARIASVTSITDQGDADQDFGYCYCKENERDVFRISADVERNSAS